MLPGGAVHSGWYGPKARLGRRERVSCGTVIAGRATLALGGGLIDNLGFSELTLGGSVAVDVLPENMSTRLSLQAGLGWMAPDVGGESLTSLSIPIGVAVNRTVRQRHVGLHAALDLLAANSSMWQGGAGVHYAIH